MFSPTGQLASFASNGSVEDIFLRFIDRPDELKGGPICNEEYLSQQLKQLKYEGEMLEKIATIEALERKLEELNQRQREAQEKMRYYEPNVEKINSVLEAGVYQQFLTSAIQRVEHSKAKLLGNWIAQLNPESNEEAAVDMEDADSITDESEDSNNERHLSRDEYDRQETCLCMGPHLSLGFIQAQKSWNLSGGKQAPKLNIK